MVRKESQGPVGSPVAPSPGDVPDPALLLQSVNGVGKGFVAVLDVSRPPTAGIGPGQVVTTYTLVRRTDSSDVELYDGAPTHDFGEMKSRPLSAPCAAADVVAGGTQHSAAQATGDPPTTTRAGNGAHMCAPRATDRDCTTAMGDTGSASTVRPPSVSAAVGDVPLVDAGQLAPQAPPSTARGGGANTCAGCAVGGDCVHASTREDAAARTEAADLNALLMQRFPGCRIEIRMLQWMSHHQVLLVRRFGGIRIVDWTSKTNDEGYDVGVPQGITGRDKTYTMCTVLVRGESKESVRFLHFGLKLLVNRPGVDHFAQLRVLLSDGGPWLLAVHREIRDDAAERGQIIIVLQCLFHLITLTWRKHYQGIANAVNPTAGDHVVGWLYALANMGDAASFNGSAEQLLTFVRDEFVELPVQTRVLEFVESRLSQKNEWGPSSGRFGLLGRKGGAGAVEVAHRVSKGLKRDRDLDGGSKTTAVVDRMDGLSLRQFAARQRVEQRNRMTTPTLSAEAAADPVMSLVHAVLDTTKLAVFLEHWTRAHRLCAVWTSSTACSLTWHPRKGGVETAETAVVVPWRKGRVPSVMACVVRSGRIVCAAMNGFPCNFYKAYALGCEHCWAANALQFTRQHIPFFYFSQYYLGLWDAEMLPRSANDFQVRLPFERTATFEVGQMMNPPPPSVSPEQRLPTLDVAPGVGEETLLACLKATWKLSTFVDGQLAVIQAVCSGNDAAVYWPTGHGKSLVYQLPAIATGKTALVVSPLLALMHDQVASLNRVAGAELACYVGPSQLDAVIERRALNGDFNVVYSSPEYLFGQRGFLDAVIEALVKPGKCACVAIDEAACVVEWGQSFRQHYSLLGEVRTRTASYHVPVLALTATATPATRAAIQRTLKMTSTTFVSALPTARKNLSLRVVHAASLDVPHHVAMLELCVTACTPIPAAAHVPLAIVFARTRRGVDELAAVLQEEAGRRGGGTTVVVAPYHAGMSVEARLTTQRRFTAGEVNVVVCTTAFGYGIDVPSVRLVIHAQPPMSVEAYFNQCGRAGRDGQASLCVLFFHDADFGAAVQGYWLKKLPTQSARRDHVANVHALRGMVENESRCRMCQIACYFDGSTADGATVGCGTCDNCTEGAGLPAYDYTAEAMLVAGVLAAASTTTPTLAQLAKATLQLPRWPPPAPAGVQQRAPCVKAIATLLCRHGLVERRGHFYNDGESYTERHQLSDAGRHFATHQHLRVRSRRCLTPDTAGWKAAAASTAAAVAVDAAELCSATSAALSSGDYAKVAELAKKLEALTMVPDVVMAEASTMDYVVNVGAESAFNTNALRVHMRACAAAEFSLKDGNRSGRFKSLKREVEALVAAQPPERRLAFERKLCAVKLDNFERGTSAESSYCDYTWGGHGRSGGVGGGSGKSKGQLVNVTALSTARMPGKTPRGRKSAANPVCQAHGVGPDDAAATAAPTAGAAQAAAPAAHGAPATTVDAAASAASVVPRKRCRRNVLPPRSTSPAPVAGAAAAAVPAAPSAPAAAVDAGTCAARNVPRKRRRPHSLPPKAPPRQP
jgi:ATP-dependent DNA helicase RecQ